MLRGYETVLGAHVVHADLGHLLQTYKRLRDEGIVPYWCINHGPSTWSLLGHGLDAANRE